MQIVGFLMRRLINGFIAINGQVTMYNCKCLLVMFIFLGLLFFSLKMAFFSVFQHREAEKAKRTAREEEYRQICKQSLSKLRFIVFQCYHKFSHARCKDFSTVKM